MDYLYFLLSCHLTDCIREALAEPGTLCLLKKRIFLSRTFTRHEAVKAIGVM